MAIRATIFNFAFRFCDTQSTRVSVILLFISPSKPASNFGAILREGEPELSPEEALKRKAAFLGEFPLGRMGTAEDIANATVFLASDVTSYVTGQVLHVSGGSVM